MASNQKTRINAVRKGLYVGGQPKNQTEPRRRVAACELLTPFSLLWRTIMYDKTETLKRILSAAKIYDKELNGKDLLVLAKQEKNIVSYNIRFKSYHFKHFTGVESNLSATSFYAKTINNRLLVNEFEFNDTFLIEKKMRVLENAMKLPYSAKMIGDFQYAGIKIEADMGAGSPQYVMAFRND